MSLSYLCSVSQDEREREREREREVVVCLADSGGIAEHLSFCN
jgi:hypothetical protein